MKSGLADTGTSSRSRANGQERRGRLVKQSLLVKSPPRFIADAMLGSMARKLRIFGFDTLYFAEGEDDALEVLAKKEKRAILTSDKTLYRESQDKGLLAFLVEGRTDRARLLSVQRQTGPAVAFRIGGGRASRCAVCNAELELVGRRDPTARVVPAKVLARHRLFYHCASCSKMYWRGKHWERLRRLSYSLRTKDLIRTSDAGSTDSWSGP